MSSKFVIAGKSYLFHVVLALCTQEFVNRSLETEYTGECCDRRNEGKKKSTIACWRYQEIEMYKFAYKLDYSVGII